LLSWSIILLVLLDSEHRHQAGASPSS